MSNFYTLYQYCKHISFNNDYYLANNTVDDGDEKSKYSYVLLVFH